MEAGCLCSRFLSIWNGEQTEAESEGALFRGNIHIFGSYFQFTNVAFLVFSNSLDSILFCVETQGGHSVK